MLDAAARYKRPCPVVPPAQMQQLMAQDWPGNVRELRNAADRFVLGLSTSAAPALPAPLADQVSAFERMLIEQALRTAGGNVAEACNALGLPKQTLYHKLQKYGLAAEDYR
jgi:two-component system C4-dicarboxylate transport response regulator DctD